MSKPSVVTPRMDTALTMLFDAITTTNCLTYGDIAAAGGFSSVEGVSEALVLIRTPWIATDYGWTVPHVRRGRPRPEQDYRYIVVDPAGPTLSMDDTSLVQEGTLSTARQVSTEMRNVAEILRRTVPVAADASSRRWATATATILDGVAVQTELEADRLETILGI